MKLSKVLASIALVLPLGVFASEARIISSIPVYQNYTTVEENCRMEVVPNNDKSEVDSNTLLGVVIGGVLANQIDWSTKAAQTAGVMIGAYTGGAIAHNSSKTKTVEKCYPERITRSNLLGYDVVYTINGKRYSQRLNYDPGVGSTVRVNVTIQ